MRGRASGRTGNRLAYHHPSGAASAGAVEDESGGQSPPVLQIKAPAGIGLGEPRHRPIDGTDPGAAGGFPQVRLEAGPVDDTAGAAKVEAVVALDQGVAPPGGENDVRRPVVWRMEQSLQPQLAQAGQGRRGDVAEPCQGDAGRGPRDTGADDGECHIGPAFH